MSAVESSPSSRHRYPDVVRIHPHLPTLLLVTIPGILLTIFLLRDSIKDKAAYSADILLRGVTPRNHTDLSAAAASAFSSLAAYASNEYVGDEHTAIDGGVEAPPGVYIPLHQNVWATDDDEHPGQYRGMHQNVWNEATLKALDVTQTSPSASRTRVYDIAKEETDGICSKYTTSGWHEGNYQRVYSPTESPNGVEWTWQQCARECAKLDLDQCEYWTLQLGDKKLCIMLTSKGTYHDKDGGHFEGDRDVDCLEEDGGDDEGKKKALEAKKT